MITISAPAKKNQDFVKVRLCKKRDAKGFTQGAGIVPGADGGVDLLVDAKEFKAFQKAGRSLEGFGVSKARLSFEDGLKYGFADLLDFVTGMFDLRHELELAIDLPKKDIALLDHRCNLLATYRMIANSSARESTPRNLADRLCDLLGDACTESGNGKMEVQKIARGTKGFAECRGLEAVGLASDNDPVMVVADFTPKGSGKDKIDIALVGKGITFDTGGYDLKPASGMATMRTDKSGAVYTCGALDFAIRAGLRKPVRLYLCLSENMVGSRGMLPGDIIEYADGTTVEVTNTDAEGRLVLADALIHASKAKIKTVIDAATLTGAAKSALGRDMCAVFTRDNRLPQSFARAFENNHEDFWLMPMRQYHKKMLSSKRADIVNSPSGDGIPGASTAAAFLDHFVDKKTRLIHIDLANAYCVNGSAYYAPGSTGACILSLSEFIREL